MGERKGIRNPLAPDGYYSQELGHWEQFMASKTGITDAAQIAAMIAVLARYYFTCEPKGNGRIQKTLNALGSKLENHVGQIAKEKYRDGNKLDAQTIRVMAWQDLSISDCRLRDCIDAIPEYNLSRDKLRTLVVNYSIAELYSHMRGDPTYDASWCQPVGKPDDLVLTEQHTQIVTDAINTQNTSEQVSLILRVFALNKQVDSFLWVVNHEMGNLQGSRKRSIGLHRTLQTFLENINTSGKATLDAIDAYLSETGQSIKKLGRTQRLPPGTLVNIRIYFMNKVMERTPSQIRTALSRDCFRIPSDITDYCKKAVRKVQRPLSMRGW